MAAEYFPFDSGPGSNVTEAMWNLMAKNWLGTGVIKGAINELQVYADSTGMQAKVKAGQAWIEGFFFQIVTESIIPISPANATNPRIDRIAIQVDWTNNNISLIAIQGAPASSPTPPALTQNTSIWQMSLAQIYVGANVSTIVGGNITDERVYTGQQLLTDHFILNGSTWGGIGSSGTLNQVPLTGTTVAGISKNGFHVGTSTNNSILVCDSPGRYLIKIDCFLSGLNQLAEVDAVIRFTDSVTSAIADNDMGIYGFTGAGGNYSAPYGIPFSCECVWDMKVNDTLDFFVRCSESPRTVNSYFISVTKL
jgi:hypothetical protein